MDITPVFPTIPAELEIVIPQQINDAPAQTIGGFVATPSGLNQGQLSISGTGQYITMGVASDINTGVGIFMGADNAATVGYDFRVGDPAGNYMKWDASAATLSIKGAISASSLDIPDTTTANSFHVDSSGNMWLGATSFASSNAKISNAGAATFNSITITGGSISSTPISSIPNNSSTDISLLEFTQNIVFSSTGASSISWTSGTINLSNGRTFSISSGSKSSIAALTYVYLDPGTSTTVLQTTTTYSTAIGANKILIAATQNNTTAASIITYGGGQPILDGAGNIAALSITAASIAASTITAGKLSVSQLSAIAADMGTLTTGVINMSSGTSNIHAGQTAWDNGTGFWFEYNSGTPRFSIGNSAGAKVTWDGTTLSIVGNEKVSKSYTAGGTITSGDAVYLDGYQSDGGPLLDLATQGTGTSDGSGNATLATLNIGNNSNRYLVIGLYVNSSSASTATLSFNGSAMTQIDKIEMPSSGGFVYTFQLIAPTTGSHSLTGTGFASTVSYRYHVGSYYNCKQSAQPDGHNASTTTWPTPASVTLTPTLAGSLFWGFTVDQDSTSNLSPSGIPNNQASGTTLFQGLSGDNGAITIISPQTLTASGASTNRLAAFAVSIAPFTTAIPSVKSTSASASSTCASFIGFATASAVAGNAIIATVAGEASGLSGLTFGAQYYLSNSTGAISTTTGSVTRKVGIATSSTTLTITNIW